MEHKTQKINLTTADEQIQFEKKNVFYIFFLKTKADFR